MCLIFAGSRYIEDVYGLRISNITLNDEGLYYCCAEVESTGRYYEKEINVLVCSKQFLHAFGSILPSEEEPRN